MLQSAEFDCDQPVGHNNTLARKLLSVEEAQAIVLAVAEPIDRTEIVAIGGVLGRRLANDVYACTDFPAFDQSAMDGFALSGERSDFLYALDSGTSGDLTGDMKGGQARRVATGHMLPRGADRVVMFEHVRTEKGAIVTDGAIPLGANIRRRGEDVRAGELLLSRGSLVGPRQLALLVAQGWPALEVIAQPRVAVLSSGSELKQPGDMRDNGGVFDCNRPMLMALAGRAGAQVTDGGCWPDEMGVLSEAVSRLAKDHDLIVMSGGSSIGDPDLTGDALRAAGAGVRDLKIAIKPGKPAIVGWLGKAAVLCVPGNPMAAYVSWFILGRELLAAMSGAVSQDNEARMATSINTLRRKRGRTQFAPVKRVMTAAGEMVEFLGRGGSASLSALSIADGLARIEASRGDVLSGERVAFLPFGDE